MPGPASTFSDIDEAIAKANDSIYGLAASIWTKDLDTAIRAGRDLEAGIVWINCFDHGDMTQPWGGYKQSGSGRDKCLEAMSQHTQTKRLSPLGRLVRPGRCSPASSSTRSRRCRRHRAHS